jgi:hypothetical protein
MRQLLFIPLFFVSCLGQDQTQVFHEPENTVTLKTISNQSTLAGRFPAPDGFNRIELDSGSFGFYLRNLELYPADHPVKLYNGSLKGNQSAHVAVIKQDIDPVDLQQCADAVMRLRGEYLFNSGQLDKIHFNFLSDGKPRYFKDYSANRSYSSFRKYMKYIFSYANTASLKKELITVASIDSILPGDVFIQSGNPYGHAVTVMDVVINDQGIKYFLLSQSYMPAQETHILKNPLDLNLSPWYKAEEGEIITPEWRFTSKDLRRFKED